MKHLSKSQYTRGIQCAKSLWLYRERKSLQDPTDAGQQAIFDAGTEVGVLAQSWIKGGVLIKADHTDPEAALLQTAIALGSGIKVIYEAAFLHDDVLVRADIIAEGPGGVWDLYEVKSSTGVEDVYLLDVAIQRYVLAGAGVKLGVAHLVHIDSSYVRHGALDLTQLFKAVDVNRETEALLDTIPGQIKRMKETAARAEAPEVAIGTHCFKPYNCDFMGTCWAHVPKYSVFNLSGALKKKTTEMWNSGVQRIDQINPALTKLTDYQKVQVAVAKSCKPSIDVAPIRELLNGIGWPRYFLDFEAVNRAIPQYDGLRPYQAMPFEASVHIIREPGAPLEHELFMADGTNDPRQDLAKFLLEVLGISGPIIAYHKSYEGGILTALSLMSGQSLASSSRLVNAGGRLWDLADPFKKAYWADPAFLGKWSIKNVLPVLVPSMTYKGMAIADGVAAMTAYARLMDESLSATERAQLIADLKDYCAQDTLAMVRILEVVEAAVAQETPA